MGEEKSIAEFNLVKRQQICMAVLERQIQYPRESLQDSCAIVDVPDRTFRSWMAQGVLDDILKEYSAAMVAAGRNIILDVWPDILKYQAKVASGGVLVKGANPTSAAEFCRKVGGIAFSVKDQVPSIGEMNVFMLPQAHVTVTDGKPNVDSMTEEPVDAEFEEVED